MFREFPVADITVAEDRQRKKIQGIEELADSIARVGLINPIVITEGGELIAGERRFRAVQLLCWETVPVQLWSELSPTERRLVELDENVKRAALAWDDECLAVLELHRILCAEHEGWTQARTADYTGIPHTTLRKYLMVGEELAAGNEKVQAAGKISVAYNMLERKAARALDDEVSKLLTTEPARPARPAHRAEDEADLPEEPGYEVSPVVQADFNSWAEGYDGPRFNFIHCDFPYGVGHHNSAQANAARYGAYDDDEDVYWELLTTLAKHWDKIMLPSSHFMFWFSMTYYTETLEFLRTELPQLEIDPFPLVWLKSDNKGILPDAARGPRRIYETALFGRTGDRKVVQSVANAYACPTGNRIHASEKPTPMLRHFFRMIVDEHTSMLDPTCGSGSALNAAAAQGAGHLVGLEKNSTYAEVASEEFIRQERMRRMA